MQLSGGNRMLCFCQHPLQVTFSWEGWGLRTEHLEITQYTKYVIEESA